MVLQTIGWILLSLLALLLVLLFAPVVAYVRFANGALSVKVRVLFVVLTVFPLPQRKPRKKKPPAKKKKEQEADASEEEEKQAPKKEKTLEQKLALVKKLVAAGASAAKPVLRNLRLNAVELVLPVHAAEAADTAVRCGQIQAGLGSLRALLDGRLKVRFKRMMIVPDFTGEHGQELYFACKVAVNPYIMVIAGFHFIKTYLSYGRRRFSKAAYKRALARKKAAAKASGPV